MPERRKTKEEIDAENRMLRKLVAKVIAIEDTKISGRADSDEGDAHTTITLVFVVPNNKLTIEDFTP